MKRYYEVSITVLRIIEIDEDEVRKKCEIPDDEEIPEEVFEGWVEDEIAEYLEENDMKDDVNDIEFDKYIP